MSLSLSHPEQAHGAGKIFQHVVLLLLGMFVVAGCSPEQNNSAENQHRQQKAMSRSARPVLENIVDSPQEPNAEFWEATRLQGTAGISSIQTYLMLRIIWNAKGMYLCGPPQGPSRMRMPASWDELRPHILLWPLTAEGTPWPLVHSIKELPGPVARYFDEGSAWQVEFVSEAQDANRIRPLEQFIVNGAFKAPDEIDRAMVRKDGPAVSCTAPMLALGRVIHTYHWVYGRLPDTPEAALDEFRLGLNLDAWQELLDTYPSVMAYRKPDGSAFAIVINGPSASRWMTLDDTSRRTPHVSEQIGYSIKPQDQARIDEELRGMEVWQDLSTWERPSVEIPQPTHPPSTSGVISTAAQEEAIP